MAHYIIPLTSILREEKKNIKAKTFYFSIILPALRSLCGTIQKQAPISLGLILLCLVTLKPCNLEYSLPDKQKDRINRKLAATLKSVIRTSIDEMDTGKQKWRRANSGDFKVYI